MRSICALVVAAMVFVAVPMAGAATVPVSITKSGYTPSTVTATTADTVQFKNDDTVVHQVAFKPTTGVTCSPSPFTLQAGQSGTSLASPPLMSKATAPARSHDHVGAVPVVLGLGDPDGLGEVLVGQFRVDDLVAVLGQEARLDATRDRVPAVEEENLHGRRCASFA